ncbi:hypothetical protein DFH06DRAFT_588075 [Mycena polygramma]|nr:hypothetical protein DFH06DRAFT_588075 [Mycena polygramma]
MQEQQSAAFTAAATSLATYFGSTADSHEIDDEDGEHPALTDEEAFSLSMEIRYRSYLRRPQFKGTTRAAQADDRSDDDELSQDQSILTPESSQRFDENYLWHHPPPIPSDFAFGFDLPLASANIERFSPLDMGIDKEYQDPAEFWSDLDDDEEEDDLLSLSSDNGANRGSTEAHFGMDLPSDDFSLVTLAPPSVCSDERVCELGLVLDVNTDGTPHTGHAEGSPDAPQLLSTPTQIESQSVAEHLWRQATKEEAVPRLSSMHALDLELSFDSDSDAFELEESSDTHELEEFVDDVTASGTWPGGTLEHQAGLPNIATDVGAGRGVEHIGLDEDW